MDHRMNVFELTRKLTLGEEDFPLSAVQAKVTLMLESKVDLPPAAARRMALRELRRLLAETEEEELLSVANTAADLYSSSVETVENDNGTVTVHANGSRTGWVQPAG
ncbi:MAG TPA: hypothetical protein VFH47_07865, partial [Candidatus Thermoplasmatota archaeon]|nr:hypothetical protein [Candidatus Thermoplasmatota archaeon]